MSHPKLLPNGPYGPELGSFGQVARNVEDQSNQRLGGTASIRSFIGVI